MRIHCSSVVFRPIWHFLRSEICESWSYDQYLVFSVHSVEEKTFSSRLEICLQMSTKMSQNAPKVVHFIKKKFRVVVGMPPTPPLAYARYACLIILIIVIPLFSICCSHLCYSWTVHYEDSTHFWQDDDPIHTVLRIACSSSVCLRWQ